MNICLVPIILSLFSMCFVSSFAAIRRIGASISCYSCSSRNGSDPHCSDPFNPAFSKYVENCKVPKNQNHIGVFPARFCIKVKGKTVRKRKEEQEELLIRACSLENMDNQCGNFKFEKDTLKGCILTCDYDGCNRSAKPLPTQIFDLFLVAFVVVLLIS